MEQQDNTLVMPDFSEVKDRVEPGIYKARITGAKVGKWDGKDGKKDTHYVGWELETYGEAEDKNNGRKIFHNTPINGAGAFRLKDFYKAAMGEDIQGQFDPAMLFGHTVELTMGVQKNNPEYNEVKAVKAIIAQH